MRCSLTSTIAFAVVRDTGIYHFGGDGLRMPLPESRGADMRLHHGTIERSADGARGLGGGPAENVGEEGEGVVDGRLVA